MYLPAKHANNQGKGRLGVLASEIPHTRAEKNSLAKICVTGLERFQQKRRGPRKGDICKEENVTKCQGRKNINNKNRIEILLLFLFIFL
jgi:hypothetical protein